MGAYNAKQKQAALLAEGWTSEPAPKRGATGRTRWGWRSPDRTLLLPTPEAFRHLARPPEPKGMVRVRHRAFRGVHPFTLMVALLGKLRGLPRPGAPDQEGGVAP